jgi:hypothetical protein
MYPSGSISAISSRTLRHPSAQRRTKILAVERRHADAGLHPIAFGQVFEADPGPDIRPAETGLAHDGLSAVAGRLQPFD